MLTETFPGGEGHRETMPALAAQGDNAVPMDWYEVPADPLVSLPRLVLLLYDTINDHSGHLFIGEAEQVLQYVLVMLAHERSGPYLRLHL